MLGIHPIICAMAWRNARWSASVSQPNVLMASLASMVKATGLIGERGQVHLRTRSVGWASARHIRTTALADPDLLVRAAQAGATEVALVSAATYLPFGPLAAITYGNARRLTKHYGKNYQPSAIADSAGELNLTLGTDLLGNITGLTEKAGAAMLNRTIEYD